MTNRNLAALKAQMPLKVGALHYANRTLSVLFCDVPSKYELGAVEALAPLVRVNVWHLNGSPIDCETDEPNPFGKRRVERSAQ
jgi:hypothetical protein